MMKFPKSLTTVTPLSKALAMILFILFPLMGFLLGMEYQKVVNPIQEVIQPVKTVLPNKIKIEQKPTSKKSIIIPNQSVGYNQYINTEYGFSLLYPILNTNIEESYQAVLFSLKLSSKRVETLPSAPFFTISIIPDDLKYRVGDIYDLPERKNLEELLKLELGKSGSTDPQYPEYKTFTRLSNIIVDNSEGIVLENSKIMNYMGRNRKILIKRSNKLYILSTYYQTQTELTNFEYMFSTFKFLDNNQIFESNGWKTYSNLKYRYQFQYPSAWNFADYGSNFEVHNKIESKIEVWDKTYKFSVWIDENQPKLMVDSVNNKKILVDGTTVTVYVFPQGYECGGLYGGGNSSEECSFFHIPIFKNDVWYSISGVGYISDLNNIYSQILSTFKFTN